ncbi:MAG TPA: hypothetical protein VE377_11600 [Candidatus Dormibacteraeota bacterium]|nr:hypothetical protein [Candidatus Dormibacteraeota bacterium]
MVSTLILICLGVFTWTHLRPAPDPTEIKAGPILEQARRAQQTQQPSSDPEAQDAQPAMTMVGPLANYMNHQGSPKVNDIETIPYKPVKSDYVGGSVVGTSSTVLHQSFGVSGTVDLPFEVPAHAYNPQLHGSFRSFVNAGGKPSSDASEGDVEFLLLNDRQFSDFVAGRPSEAVFSADAAHDQAVNANLPPTLGQPVKYHLIFRNGAPRAGKKVVEADFRVNF